MVHLEPGHIHAWCRETNAAHYDQHLTALSSAERARCDRFHFDRDRRDYANAHDLLRRTLSRYDTASPELWQFEAASGAKPYLKPGSPGSEACSPLDFNLSHTHGLVACVVGRGAKVGIDVERIDRLHDAIGLATRFFSPAEVTDLNHYLGENARARRFIELWTLKESFIKAIGKGLSQPLDSFSFGLDEAGAICFTPPPEFATETWYFAQYDVAPKAVLAIAVRARRSPTFVVQGLEDDRVVDIRPSRSSRFDF
jgi:4'-phosphopantetheinyl transferase